MNCVNCGRKGHAASVCSQPRKEKGERPCFTCGKVGHEARACPDKPAARAPLKAITMGPAEQGGPKKQYVFCVTALERKAPLGGFIKDKGHVNHNRFQPLTLDVWQGLLNDDNSNLPPPSACISPISSPSPTSTSLPRMCARALTSRQLGETRQICDPLAQGGENAVLRVVLRDPNLQKCPSQAVGSVASTASADSYHIHSSPHTYSSIATHTHTSSISTPTTATTTTHPRTKLPRMSYVCSGSRYVYGSRRRGWKS